MLKIRLAMAAFRDRQPEGGTWGVHRTITAREYRNFFTANREFAVIDTREIDEFNRGHLLAASNLPLSRLEIDAPRHLLHPDVTIVLSDWASARRSASVLADLGYRDIRAMEGGLSGWHLHGGRLFVGWNVIGKAFGSYIVRTRRTPIIDAVRLKEMMDSGRPPIILDTRPLDEHREYCIPGALDCPNGETLYRALAAIDDPTRSIVTHCAGHTRAVIGAQTLIEAGLPNPISALHLGTMEWALAGLELEYDADRLLAPPDDLTEARRLAASFGERSGVSHIDMATLRSWQDEAATHGLLVFDLRSPDEHLAGTWPGARQVVGSQLVQATDRHIATRNGRVVLIDCDGVRGTTTAAWLNQMGYRGVAVLTANPGDLTAVPTQNSDRSIGAAALRKLGTACEDGSVLVADIRGGVAHRRRHVEGAVMLGRANLADDVQELPPDVLIALHTDEPVFADLMAADLERLGRRCRVVADPLDAWEAAGFRLATGPGRMLSEPHDAVYDLEELEIHLRDSHEYILWRENLYEMIDDDPATPYMQSELASG